MNARLSICLFLCLATIAVADETIHRYEGDVHPLDPTAGWQEFNPCDPPCSDFLEDGHYVRLWSEASDPVNFDYRIAVPPIPPPPTLWVEWRFRSNFPLGPMFTDCDASVNVHYKGISDGVDVYGDSVLTFDATRFVLGLSMDDFHTYRFESPDGKNYWWSVDGDRFAIRQTTNVPNGFNSIQMQGKGGCFNDWHPDMQNEWDYVRYGTISFGERVITTDPPSGTIPSETLSALDSFTVAFNSANYVYLDEIRVFAGGIAPRVVATGRRESYAVNTLRIVLDRPPASGRFTRFVLDDGVATNVIEFSDLDLEQGACCLPDGVCQRLSQLGCGLNASATFNGVGSSCTDADLPCHCSHDGDQTERLWRMYICMSGPALFAPNHCTCADQDEDGDVDLRDFAGLQRSYPKS